VVGQHLVTAVLVLKDLGITQILRGGLQELLEGLGVRRYPTKSPRSDEKNLSSGVKNSHTRRLGRSGEELELGLERLLNNFALETNSRFEAIWGEQGGGEKWDFLPAP